MSTALVTGASSGIGAEYARRLAADGHDLILVARRADRLEALAAGLPTPATPLVADLETADGRRRVADAIAAADDLAFVVNNAGWGGYAPFHELELETVQGLIAIHVQAVAELTHAAVRAMLPRGAGAIVNVASRLALSGTIPPDPMPHRAVYAGAKSFIVTFTQAIAGELEGTGLRVQALLPGLVTSEFHEVRGTPMPPAPPQAYMSPQDLVAGSLDDLARGRVTSAPSVPDELIDAIDASQRAVFGR
jgi:short-subunit dehydrogenase